MAAKKHGTRSPYSAYDAAKGEEIVRRRRIVSSLRAAHWTYEEIIAALAKPPGDGGMGKKYSKATISGDCKAIRRALLEEVQKEQADHVADCVASLREIGRQAFGRGTVQGLRLARDTVRDEADLFGLFPPKKYAPTTPGGDEPWEPMAPEELAARLRDILGDHS